MKSIVSKLVLVAVVATLAACRDNNHQAQYQQPYQPQPYQQQPQVVVQQAPQDNSSAITAAIGGAAIGALAANAFNRNQNQVVTREVVVPQSTPQVTQPSQQRPWFRPNELPAKQAVAPTPTPAPAPVAVKPQVAPPKPSYVPQSSYKQSAPRVTYSSSSSSSSRRK